MYQKFIDWLHGLDDKYFGDHLYEKEYSIKNIDLESLYANVKDDKIESTYFIEYNFYKDNVKYRKRVSNPQFNKSTNELLKSENIVEEKKLLIKDDDMTLSTEKKISLNNFNSNIKHCYFIRSYFITINNCYKFDFRFKTKIELSSIPLDQQLFRIEKSSISYLEIEYVYKDKSRINTLDNPKINNFIFNLPPNTIYDNDFNFRGKIKTSFKNPVALLKNNEFVNKIINVKSDGFHIIFENKDNRTYIKYEKIQREFNSNIKEEFSGEGEFINNKIYPFLFYNDMTRLESFEWYNSLLDNNTSELFFKIDYFIASNNLPSFVKQVKYKYENTSIRNDGFVIIDPGDVTNLTNDYKFKFDNTIDLLAIINPLQIIESENIKKYTIKLFYGSPKRIFFSELFVDIKNIEINLKKGFYTYLGYDIPFISVVEYSLEQKRITKVRYQKTNKFYLYNYSGNSTKVINDHIKYFNNGSLNYEKFSLLEFKNISSIIEPNNLITAQEDVGENVYLKQYKDFVKTIMINNTYYRIRKGSYRCCVETDLYYDLNKYFMIHPSKIIFISTNNNSINLTKTLHNKSSKNARGKYFDLDIINNDFFNNFIKLKTKCSFEIGINRTIYESKDKLKTFFTNLRENIDNLPSMITLFNCKKIRDLIISNKKNSISINIDNTSLTFLIDEKNTISFFVNSERIISIPKKDLRDIYSDFSDNGFEILMEEDYTLINKYKTILNNLEKYGSKQSSVYNFLSRLNIIEDNSIYDFLSLFKIVVFIKTR